MSSVRAHFANFSWFLSQFLSSAIIAPSYLLAPSLFAIVRLNSSVRPLVAVLPIITIWPNQYILFPTFQHFPSLTFMNGRTTPLKATQLQFRGKTYVYLIPIRFWIKSTFTFYLAPQLLKTYYTYYTPSSSSLLKSFSPEGGLTPCWAEKEWVVKSALEKQKT